MTLTKKSGAALISILLIAYRDIPCHFHIRRIFNFTKVLDSLLLQHKNQVTDDSTPTPFAFTFYFNWVQ